MPHGSLTPLGRRLRSVLAALRPVRYDVDTSSLTTARNSQCPPRYTTSSLTRSATTPRPRGQSQAIAPVSHSRAQHVATAPLEQWQPAAEADQSAPHLSRRRLNRRTKIDHLGDELRRQSKDHAAPVIEKNKRPNHFNFRSRDGGRTYTRNKKRHAFDYNPPLEKEETPTLPRILASYLRGVGEGNIDQQGNEQRPSFEPSTADQRFLLSKGYGVADLDAWAAIITEPDSFEAANALQMRVLHQGPQAVPLPVFSYILRRPYVSARALRILIANAWHLFEELESGQSGHISADAVFLVFTRLVRHALKVWPEALASIADHLLRFVPQVRANRDGDVSEAAQRTSYMLNKAMYLMSEPAAVAPFKNVVHQQAAVIRILTALNEYDVPLQIDREGYRAVIRLQLASEKTDSEQRWAELKALSWPPWKHDQTRMDTELGPEHGISRAGETLQRMQEAGYALQHWERVAKVYTGWDVDGTPTIQRRMRMQPVRAGQTPEAALWVARISTTRTVQEAWACYLAYEDAHDNPDQDVLLAIFEKLFQEGTRRGKESHPERAHEALQEFETKRLFPGDTKEIEPLPPSTHLYTYTRVEPPTALHFFSQLRERGIQLDQTHFAFLISNARSAKECVVYLSNAAKEYPSIHGVLNLDSSADLDGAPDGLFEAYIKYLTRFSNNVMNRALIDRHRNPVMSVPSRRLADETFNLDHCLVQAIWLLHERKTFHLPSWNAVLDALAHSKNYSRLHLVQNSHEMPPDPAQPPDLNFNTILSYRLTQQVLKLLTNLHLDLDHYGFIALCRSTENVSLASWQILQNDANDSVSDTAEGTPKKPIPVTEAKQLLTRDKPQWRLEQYFRRLVGEHSYIDPAHTPGSSLPPKALTCPGIPRLLTAPSPAVMHAYIRALGWCGAYKTMLETVKWMVEYRDELADSAAQDRNGANVSRRTMAALRVFLERSWLLAEEDAVEEDEGDEEVQAPDYFERVEAREARDGRSLALRRLEDPAPEEFVDEVKGLVESVEEWGGWATDDEVRLYVKAGFERFKRVM